MRPYFLLIPLLLVACREEDQLRAGYDPLCGTPCYDGPAGKAGVGQCARGMWECEGPGAEPICVGSVAPSKEECDGLDNDCDGVVDHFSVSCSSSCGSGTAMCKNGQVLSCSAIQPKEEICNGRDDDCDGVVDNPDKLPLEFCYSGPVGTAGVGECHPGISRCVAGKTYCYGQGVPSSEICDGLDNNCNGIVDDGATGSINTAYDFVFVVDNSGSMGYVIEGLKQVTINWSQKYGSDPNFRWALVGAPGPDASRGTEVVLYQDFTDAVQFATAMSQQWDNGYGQEPTADALWLTLDPSNPLLLSWRNYARKAVIMFTDENAQSYLNPAVTSVGLSSRISSGSTPVVVFTSSSLVQHWNAYVPSPQGKVLNIAMDPVQMETTLDSLIASFRCQ